MPEHQANIFGFSKSNFSEAVLRIYTGFRFLPILRSIDARILRANWTYLSIEHRTMICMESGAHRVALDRREHQEIGAPVSLVSSTGRYRHEDHQ